MTLRRLALASRALASGALASGALAILAGQPGRADAQTTLETVRHQGFVRCGSVERPGLAWRDDAGHWSGLHVEVCRAVAAAALGRGAAIAFHAYGSERDFAGAGDGTDQIAFLAPAEVAEHGLSDALAPGPTVFVEGHDLLVAAGSPVRHAEQLATRPICFIIGTAANDSLEAWFGARHASIVRYAFRETDEMNDAYAVQRCAALVGESTALAQTRLEGGVNHLASRLLPEHLARFPIGAATPAEGDRRWAAIVALTIATLRGAGTGDRAGDAGPPPIDRAALGLPPDWRHAVLATTGDYDAIFARTVGAGSPLKLQRGLDEVVTSP